MTGGKSSKGNNSRAIRRGWGAPWLSGSCPENQVFYARDAAVAGVGELDLPVAFAVGLQLPAKVIQQLVALFVLGIWGRSAGTSHSERQLKLVRFLEKGKPTRVELYDLSKDANEMENLVAQQREITTRLLKLLRQAHQTAAHPQFRYVENAL
jgi:hypothetical protein